MRSIAQGLMMFVQTGNPLSVFVDSVEHVISPTSSYALEAPSTYVNDGNRTGSYHTLVFPLTGFVKFKMWGAGGGGDSFGNNRGGAGGYAEAEIFVQSGQAYTLLVGQPGWTGTVGGLSGAGGFGGGGTTHTDDLSLFGPTSTPYGIAGASVSHSRGAVGGGGGGATALFLGSSASVGSEIIVAGGGGGGGYNGAAGGAGGGSTGEASSANGGKGGTQSAGGASGTGLSDGDGAAGRGGRGEGRGGGGGAGYFGGGGGADSSPAGGGGGSGYFHPTLTRLGVLTGGLGATPGNSADADRNGAADGGSFSPDTYGGPGRVVIYAVPE